MGFAFMSNPYATTDNLFAMYDQRPMLNLSGDKNASQGDLGNVQIILDIQASELESHLSGRIGLPMTITPIPLILTKWVCVTACARMYGRRNDIPKQVVKDLEWAESWIKLFDDGMVQIPGVTRGELPALQDSDFVDGRSRFDYVFGSSPSPTGPTAAGGQNIQD